MLRVHLAQLPAAQRSSDELPNPQHAGTGGARIARYQHRTDCDAEGEKERHATLAANIAAIAVLGWRSTQYPDTSATGQPPQGQKRVRGLWATAAQMRAAQGHTVQHGGEQKRAPFRVVNARAALPPTTLGLGEGYHDTYPLQVGLTFVRGRLELVLDVFRKMGPCPACSDELARDYQALAEGYDSPPHQSFSSSSS